MSSNVNTYACVCACTTLRRVVVAYFLRFSQVVKSYYIFVSFIKRWRGLFEQILCTYYISVIRWKRSVVYIFRYQYLHNVCRLLHFHVITAGVSVMQHCILLLVWYSHNSVVCSCKLCCQQYRKMLWMARIEVPIGVWCANVNPALREIYRCFWVIVVPL